MFDTVGVDQLGVVDVKSVASKIQLGRKRPDKHKHTRLHQKGGLHWHKVPLTTTTLTEQQ